MLDQIASSKGYITKREPSGEWVTESLKHGPASRKKHWEHGDMSVAPDGRLQYHNNATGERILVRAADGMQERIDKFGRSTFGRLDLTSEKARLEQVIDSRFPEAGRCDRFRKLATEFETEARKRGLPDSEIAELYVHLKRMMADDAGSPLSLKQRADLAEQTLNHAAYPTSIDQGGNSTCNVATLEHMLYAHNPAKMAQLISDVSLTGKYVTADGVTVDLHNVRNGFHPDAESRRSIALQRDGSQPMIKQDGPRDHASQIAETALVNAHYAKHSMLMKGNQRVWTEDFHLDAQGNAVYSSKSVSDMGRVFDANGKEMNYCYFHYTTVLFDKDGLQLRPSQLVFGDDGGRRYVKGLLETKDRTPLFDETGNPLRHTKFAAGQVIRDAKGKELFRQTKPGQVIYDKPPVNTPFEPGEQLRVQKQPGAPEHRVVDTNGKKTDAPGLYNNEIADLYARVSGQQRRAPILLELGDKMKVRKGDNVATISSEAELHQVLAYMQQNKQFPIIMAVYANQPPFQPAGLLDRLFAGGTDSYHVINIQGYDMATRTVKFTNQWGSHNDHVDNGGVPLATMFQGMNKPKK